MVINMLPNHFVILWDGLPLAINEETGRPYKTQLPGQVKYFINRSDANSYLDMNRQPGGSYIYRAEVKEVQFRIV